MELYVVDGGNIKDIYFDGEGCCISQAAASMLVERFDGRTVEEVRQFTAQDMLALFGVRLTPNRQKCALLPWRVLQQAIYSPVAGGHSPPTYPVRDRESLTDSISTSESHPGSLTPSAHPNDGGGNRLNGTASNSRNDPYQVKADDYSGPASPGVPSDPDRAPHSQEGHEGLHPTSTPGSISVIEDPVAEDPNSLAEGAWLAGGELRIRWRDTPPERSAGKPPLLLVTSAEGPSPTVPAVPSGIAAPGITPGCEPLDPTLYRPDFPVLTREIRPGVPLVYLDNAATTQAPRQVIDAIRQLYERSYGNVHRGIHTLAEESTELFEATREKLRRVIGAQSAHEIIFTHGATESINLVARTWAEVHCKPGDEIILTQLEHHANWVPWHQLAERNDMIIRTVPITEEGLLDLDHFLSLLNEKTRLVGVTAVSNVLGTIVPLEAIIRAAHDCGARVLVDGAQWVPHAPVDVRRLHIDFLAFSGHKMLGPSGVGALYAKEELLEQMPPFLGGGHMIHEVREDGFVPAKSLPDRFEAGTPPIVSAIAWGAAIDYVMQIGLDRIAAHEHRLTQRAHELLGGVPGVRILGPPPEYKAGIVSFVVEGVHPHDLAAALDRFGIAVRAGHHCAMPLHRRLGIPASTRASFYLYNLESEVEKLAEAVERARHLFAPN